MGADDLERAEWVSGNEQPCQGAVEPKGRRGRHSIFFPHTPISFMERNLA